MAAGDVFDHPTARQLAAALLPQTTSEALPGAEMRASPTSPSSHVTPSSISSRITFIKDSYDRFPPMREEHPSLRLVRKAKMGALPSRPPIVLVHGLDGRIDSFNGFDRTQCLDHDLLALVPAVDLDATTDPLRILDEYTKACVSHFGTTTAFHMIAYSFGALLARCIAGNVAQAGGCPLGLVLLDPPPFFQRGLGYTLGRLEAAMTALSLALRRVVHDAEVSIEDIIADEFPDLQEVREDELATYIIGEAFATRTYSTALAERNHLNRQLNAIMFCANDVMTHISGCHMHQKIPVKVMVALASPEDRSSFWIPTGYSAEDMSEESHHASIELRVPGDHHVACLICASGSHGEFNDSLRDFFSAIETIPKEEH